jgi:undecaprenyl diphosphate synthase
MPGNLLRHVAIIMDGNNRWATGRGLSGLAGHRHGVERVRDILEACRDSGVEVLTLFAFSSENWQRPPDEVSGLMSLFSTYLKKETGKLKKENVRLRVVGRRDRLSPALLELIDWAEQETAGCEMNLVLAVDYGGRWDITEAARKLAEQVANGLLSTDAIDEEMLGRQLVLADLPEPDLLIRTSGELRVSNFLLWQLAYTEFYFSDVLWPDFGREELERAFAAYQDRTRRYGLRDEQLADRGELN